MQREGELATCAMRSSSQEALAKIWSEVLGLADLEPGANFFDIGGDSLNAMDVIARVGETFGVELPVMAFFEDPTVGHLASVIDDLKAGETKPSITRVPGRTEFPLSYSQQVFWLLEQQNPGTGLYNTARVFRICGNVDSSVLERSLIELRRRHEILNVRFIPTVDGPIQIVEATSPLPLAVSDLSRLELCKAQELASKLALETIREPFDLAAGPALRARLIRLAVEEWLLCLAIHHAISDGFTGSILLDELCAIYDRFASGHPNCLPELDFHYTDYAAWERQWMHGDLLDQELDHWRSVLRDGPSSLNLPSDFASPSEPDRHGRLRCKTIPAELLRQVQEFALANGTTLFTVLATAFRILLFRWCGQSDFVIGTIASNRSRSGADRLIGCFVNPLPLRNPVTVGQSLQDILNSENQSVMQAFAHQDCPFAKIVEAINPERTTNDNPLFNVALLLQNFPSIEQSGRYFYAEHVDFDAHVALLDLRFIAMERSDGLQLTCEYKSSLFKEDTIGTLLGAYADILQSTVNDPGLQVADVGLPESLVQQAAAARARDRKRTSAIAASFTAEPLEESLSFLLNELGMNYSVAFAPYQQVFQQLLDPQSLLRSSDGFKIVLIRFEDFAPGHSITEPGARETLSQVVDHLILALRAAEDGKATSIVCFCPPSSAISDKPGLSEWLQSLESRVADAFAGNSLVQVICSREILDLYPVEEYDDEYARRLGNVPYTADFFSALGSMLTRRMWGVTENRYSTIAIDCDGVLWESRGGEGQFVADKWHIALQCEMLKQRDAGKLLCLCSKSRQEDVWAAFDANPAMPLHHDDFVASAIGPEASEEKLRSLATELGLELDRFIFLHADLAESSAMEVACPEVLVLQVPRDPADIPGWLQHVWAFDRHRTGLQETFLTHAASYEFSGSESL
ncbi:MAG: hypothetical protein JO061_22020 [Acidobacteriaceae bacterium]|nr:hypothetical protein [Acidobacteriaceae bacterium]